MPLCSAVLVKLTSGTTRETFLKCLLSSPLADKVRIAARVRAPVIRATKIDNVFLNSTRWDLFLVLGPGLHSLLDDSGQTIAEFVETQYRVSVGVPARILESYTRNSDELNAKTSPQLKSDLKCPATTILGKPAKDSQNLEVSEELLNFAEELCREHPGSVSMLNLLHFFDGKEELESYHRYGQGFAKLGDQFGGNAKFVGRVVTSKDSAADSRGTSRRDNADWWNEISFVHYPSIQHFCDMAASHEYQDINRKYRIHALRDTTIICCTEVDLSSIRGSRL